MGSTPPVPLFTAPSKITGISYYGTQLYYTSGSCMYSYSTGVSTIVAGIRSLSAQTADGAYPTTTGLVSTVAFCTDMNGNRYIVDKSGSDNTKSVIVKMPTYTPLQAGLTYNLAGTNACDSGVNTCVGTFTNNQPAYSETFGAIKGMCYDSVGNLYVCDAAQHIVARMGATGTMSVYAGTLGQAGSSGDGAIATSAKVSSPSDIKMSRGNILYIADTGNNKIRRVKMVGSTGIIETMSFTGFTILSPKCLAFDANENLYVVGSSGGNTIYRISNFGIATSEYTASPTSPITSITVDRATNTLYFSTPTNVWKLVTGTPVLVLSGLTAANGLAIDSTNNLYVSDSTTNKVFRAPLNPPVSAMNISSMNAYIGNGEQEPSFSITSSVTPNIYGNAGPPTTRALTSPGAIVVNPSQGILVAQPTKVTLLATTSAAELPSCANKISHISIRNISIMETMYLSQIVALNSSGVNVLLRNPTGVNSAYASYTDGTYACKSKDIAYAILPKMTLTIPISPPDDIVIVLLYPSSTNKVNWNGATIRTTQFPVGSSNNPVRIIQGVSESPAIKNFVIDYRTKSATCAPYINFMNKYKLQSSVASPIDTSYREKWVRYVRISPTATTGTPQISGLTRVYVIDGETGEDRILGKVPNISMNVRNSTDTQYGDAYVVNRKNNLEALTKPDSGTSFSNFPTKSGAAYLTPVTISDVWLEYDLMDEYPIERVIIEPASATTKVTFFTSSRAVVENPTASIIFSTSNPSYNFSLFAGRSLSGYMDGPIAQSGFGGIYAIARNSMGDLYVGDTVNGIEFVRKIAPNLDRPVPLPNGVVARMSGAWNGPGEAVTYITIINGIIVFIMFNKSQFIKTIDEYGNARFYNGVTDINYINGTNVGYESITAIGQSVDSSAVNRDQGITNGYYILQVISPSIGTINNNGTIVPIQYITNLLGMTIYLGVNGGSVVMVDTTGIARSYTGTIQNFSPDVYTTYARAATTTLNLDPNFRRNLRSALGLNTAPLRVSTVIRNVGAQTRHIAIDKWDNVYVTSGLTAASSRVLGLFPNGFVSNNVYTSSTGTQSFDAVSVKSDGTLYIVDKTRHCMYLKAPEIVSTIAGTGTSGNTAGIQATSAMLNGPCGVAYDSAGNLYIADSGNHCIKRVTTAGVIAVFAGSSAGIAGVTDSPALFNNPVGLAIDSTGNIYVADCANNRIRRITPGGVVLTIAGGGAGFSNNSTGTSANFNCPIALALNSTGSILYVADRYNNRIRTVSTVSPFAVGTLAGDGFVSGTYGRTVDGTGTAASFNWPTGLAIDPAGNLYSTDWTNGYIRKITSTGVVTTIAGTGTPGYSDGPGLSATFGAPISVAVDSAYNVYTTEESSIGNRIRKLTPSGSGYIVTTFAGAGPRGFADGATTSALFWGFGILVDQNNNIIVADWLNHRIRKITNVGLIVMAGLSGSAAYTDNATGTAARFNTPTSIALSSNETTLYVSDTANNKIRTIATTSPYAVGTYAGTATFTSPRNISLDSNGNLYVVDQTAIKKIETGPTVSTVQIGSYQHVAVSPDMGTLYLADTTSIQMTVLAASLTPSYTSSWSPSPRLLSPVVTTTTRGIRYIRLANGSAPTNSIGTLTLSALSTSTLPTGLTGLTNLALDTAGNVYAVNTQAVYKINTAGAITGVFNVGSITPSGLALDSAGNIYLTDSGSDLIQKVEVGSLQILLRAKNYTSGTTWRDESGKTGRNATMYNNLAGAVVQKNGSGNGILLNGSTWGWFPNVGVGNSWTMGVWYKSTILPSVSVEGNPGIVTQQHWGSEGKINMFLGYSPDKKVITASFHNNGFYNSPNTITLPKDEWVNIQVTWDGTNFITYLNGNMYGTTYQPGVASIDNGNPYHIGRKWDHTSGPMPGGEIGEIRIYNTPLTSSQVKSIYNESAADFGYVSSRFQGFIDGTATNTKFDSPRGTIFDANGNTYVADTGNNAIRMINPYGITRTLVSSGLTTPRGVAINNATNTLYITDTNAVRSATANTDLYSVYTLFSGLTPSSFPPPLTSLQVLLRAKNYSGTGSWTDDSDKGRNATLGGGIAAKNGSGNGIVLNGSTFWTFPNVAVGNSWSMGVWYKKTGSIPDNTAPAIVTQQFIGTSVNLMLGYFNAPNLSMSYYGPWYTSPNTITLVDNQWTNIQVTWDGTNLATYVNGNILGTAQPGFTMADAGSSYFIGRRWDMDHYVTGEIGEVRIYNTPLSSDQVKYVHDESASDFGRTPLLGGAISSLQILLRAKNYSGTGSWRDESNNGKHATMVAGGVNQKNAAGNGIVLNGSTYWTFPALPAVGNSWTANVWFKQTGTNVGASSGTPCILTQQYNSASGNDMNIGIRAFGPPSTTYQGWIYKFPQAWYTINQNTTLQMGVWTNIQITWSGTVMTTYVNGISIGSTTISLSSPLGSQNIPYNIGKRWDTNADPGNQFVRGEIGEVRIYNTALTDAEVLAAYNQSLSDFSNPQSTCIDPTTGDLYIADTGTVSKMTGITRTLPANTMTGTVQNVPIGMPGTNGPYALTVTPTGTLIVTSNNRIRRMVTDSANDLTTVRLPLSSSMPLAIGSVTTLVTVYNTPRFTIFDSLGNMYVSGLGAHAIYMETPAGVVNRFVGSPSSQSGFVDGRGDAARFWNPCGLAVDSNNNIYVADISNHRIRKIDSDRNVTTVAGSGVAGTVDAVGTAAQLNTPVGLVFDSLGNLFFSEHGASQRIRMMAPNGTVTTIAGGASGYVDGTGTAARFNNPTGMAFDSAGNLYIADRDNHRIRMITAATVRTTNGGVVSTLAGNGSAAFFNGTGTSASFSSPYGLCIDTNNNLYIGDVWNHRIRMITPAGVVTTIAGNGTAASVDGVGLNAQFNQPCGLAIDPTGQFLCVGGGTSASTIRRITIGSIIGWGIATYLGNIVSPVVDTNGCTYMVTKAQGNGHYIYKTTPGGFTYQIAGWNSTGTPVYTNASTYANLTCYKKISSIAVTASGDIYVAETDNHCIRVLRPILAAYAIWTYVGNRTVFPSPVNLVSPRNVTIDPDYNLYVIDGGNSCIRKISANGSTSTLLTGLNSFGITYDKTRRLLFVTELSNHCVSSIDPTTGIKTVIAGLSGTLGNTDGTGTAARFKSPAGIAVDTQGNLYVVDQGNNTIRRLTQSGSTWTTTTIVGSAAVTNVNLDGVGTAARLWNPYQIAVATNGDLYVACDSGDYTAASISRCIKKITSGSWVVSTYFTFSGSMTGNASNDLRASGLTVDSSNNLFVSAIGSNGHYVYRITNRQDGYVVTGNTTTLGDGYSGGINLPHGLCLDPYGNIFVADHSNNSIRILVPRYMSHVLAGNGASAFADGAGTAARFNGPNSIALDRSGNLIVADTGNHRIRKVTPAGIVTTIGGTGTATSTGDNGQATSATFNAPTSVSIDWSGAMYVTENSSKIRVLYPQYDVNLVAGSTTATASGVNPDGIGAAASFNTPTQIAWDNANQVVYVADTGNKRVRRVAPSGSVTTVYTSVNALGGITVDPSGLVYALDGGTTIRTIRPNPLTVNQIVALDSNGINVAYKKPIKTFSNPQLAFRAVSGSDATPYISAGVTSAEYLEIDLQQDYEITQVTYVGADAASGTQLLLYDAALRQQDSRTVSGSLQTVDFRYAASGTTMKFTPLLLTDSSKYMPDSTLAGYVRGQYIVFENNTAANKTITPPVIYDIYGKRLGTGLTTADSTALTTYGSKWELDLGQEYCIRDIQNTNNASIAIYNREKAEIWRNYTTNTLITAPFLPQIPITTAASSYPVRFVRISVTPAGTVTTVPSTTFNQSQYLTVDPAGNIYVSEWGGHKINKVTPDGVVSLLAGSGTGGFVNGVGSAAQFRNPCGLAIRGEFLYVADQGNHCIRRIRTSGTGTIGDVTTIAAPNVPVHSILETNNGQDDQGHPLNQFITTNSIRIGFGSDSTKHPAVGMIISGPFVPPETKVVSIESAYLSNHRYTNPQKVTISKNLTGVAANGTVYRYTFREDTGLRVLLRAKTYSGTGSWLDESGNSQHATLAAGTNAKNAAGNGIVLNGSTYWTIPALTMGTSWTANVWYKQTAASPSTAYPAILTHQFVAPHQDINISIAANGSNVFRGGIFKFNPSYWYYSSQNTTLVNGLWTNIQITWNGSSMVTYVNGVQTGTTSLSLVSALGTNTQMFNIGKRWDLAEYVTGEIGEVRIYNRALTAAEVLTAHNESAIDFINNPVGLAFDSTGNLFFSEHANGHRIKMLNISTNVVTTIAGSGTDTFANGTGLSASFNYPTGIAFDSAGNLYIADQVNHRIRMITVATVRTTNGGVVSTFAGSGTAAFTDATGASAQFTNPCGVCIDTNNNLYIGDQMNHRVRMITPAGAVTTMAGNGTAASVDGVGPNAQINRAYGVALDPTGQFLYVSQFVSGGSLRRVVMPYTVPPINHVSVIDNRGVDVAVWKIVRKVTGTAVTFDAFNGTYIRPITITTGASDRIEIDLGLAYNVTRIVVYYAGISVPVATNVITYSATGVQIIGVPVTITNTVNAITTYKSNGLRARYLNVYVPSGSANIHNMAVIDSLGRNVYTSTAAGNVYVTNMPSFGQGKTEIDLGREYNILYVVIYNKYTGSVSTILNPTVETTLTGASIEFLDAYRNIMTTRQIIGTAGLVYPIGTPISAVYLTPTDPSIVVTPGTPPTWGFSYTEKVVVTYDSATQSGSSEDEKQIRGITGYVDSAGKKVIFFTINQYIYKLYDGGLTQVYYTVSGGLRGIAISADRSTLYVCNSSTNTIGSLTATSSATWTTIAGGGNATRGSGCGLNSVDGSFTRTATQCTFNNPTGIAIDSSDILYVADTNNHLIRKLVKSGTTWTVSTYAGGTRCYGVAGEDGSSRYKIADWESCAEGRWRSGYDWGAAGRWCTVDTNYRDIAIISGADNGQSTAARFNSPKGISMGSDGKLYVADTGNSMVRVIDSSQNVTTLITGTNSLIHVTNFSGDVYFSRNSMQLSVRGSTGVESIWSEYGTSYRASGSAANTDGFLVKSAPSDIPPSSWTWPGIAANIIEAGLPSVTNVQGNIGNIGPFIFLGGTLIFVETFIVTASGSTTYVYKIRRTYESTTGRITGYPAPSQSTTGPNTYAHSSTNYFIPDRPFIGPFTASVISPATNSNAPSAITNNTFIAQITTEVIDVSMPPPVTGLYFVSISSTSIAIGWTSGGDSNASYTFTLNGVTATPIVSGMTATFNNLTPDTLLYTIDVYTSNTNGPSFPATITSYPDTTAPQLSVVTATSGSITVQWTGGDFTNYYTYTLNAQSLIPTVDNSKTNKTVIFTRDITNTRLTGNTTYYINVISNRNTGRNFSSPMLIVTTAPVMPVLSFTSINQTLSWSGGDGATSYQIMCNEVDVTSKATIDGVGKTIRFTGANALLGNTTYTFVVTATSANGSSESDPLTITTPPVAVVLTVSSISANSVTVSWTGGDGASSYRFFLYLNSGSNTAYPNPFGKIQGVNVAGEGGIIDVTTVAFCPTPVFLAQDGATVRAISTGSTNPRYFLGAMGNFRYDLYIAGLSSSPYSADTGTTFVAALSSFPEPYPLITQTGSSITITNMIANSKYTIGVIAINNNGETLATADNVKTDGTFNPTYLAPPTMNVPTSIGSLTTSNITQSTCKITYTGGDTATSLTINITLSGAPVSGGYGSLYTYNVFSRQIAFFNLNSSKTYVVTVRATNSAGTSTPSTTNITTSGLTLTITTSSITYNSATIQWTPVPGASSYKYTYNSNPDTSCTSPFTLSSLTAATTYTITVKAYDSSNVQIGIGNTTFLTGPVMPNVSQSATKAPTSITVNWSNAPSTTDYPTSGYVFTLNGAPITPTISGTSATFSSLAPGSSYTLTMKYSSTGNTGTINAYTSPIQPTINASNISNITDNSFTISWTACAGAASYRINYGSGLSTNVNSATTTQTISSLTSNTSYSVNVVAISSNSVENPSATTSVLTRPVAPINLVVSSYTNSYGCTLTWTCPGGAASYTISGFKTAITGVTSPYVVTGQDAGVTYNDVRVTAINATASVASLPISVRMIPGPIAAIAAPAAGVITQTGFPLSWGTVTGAGLGTPNAYEYSLNGGSSWTGTTSNSATISGQAAGTTITVTVRALNSSGVSAATDVSVLLKPATPTASASDWTLTGFNVSYTGVGATNWKVTVNGTDVSGWITDKPYTASYPGLNDYATTTFTVCVTIKNASGESPASATVTGYKPPQPWTLSIENRMGISYLANLRFSPSMFATTHKFYRTDRRDVELRPESYTKNTLYTNPSAVITLYESNTPGTCHRWVGGIATNPAGLSRSASNEVWFDSGNICYF